MLRAIRSTLAALCFAGLCLLFFDVSGVLPPKLAFLAKLQLVPAILAGSLATVAALVVLTLVFGRVYCSTLCPLGVMQDVISRLGGKNRFRFSPARTRLRVAVLAVFVLGIAVGVPLLFGLLEPYSAFGRIAADIMAPLWALGSNALALASERMGNFAVGPTPIWQKGLSALVAAALTLGVIGTLAWKSGRTWCNTLCPVGTVLGFCSRFAFFRPRIDAAKCTHCGLCARTCKASCIDAGSGILDSSRCVACFNCMDICRHKAIAYAPARRPYSSAVQQKELPNPARRALFAVALSAAIAPVAAQAKNGNRTIPALTRKEGQARKMPVTPPGSSGLEAFKARCTGCQLCVSACPHQVLRSFDNGIGMLQPSLSFERGYCRVNCVACSTLCPAGAIRPVSPAEKTAIQIGRAVIQPEVCIVNANSISCTACARSCPAGAINMVGTGPLKKPAVDAERCTGCGACEYVCPARPFAAICVEGNLEHRRI